MTKPTLHKETLEYIAKLVQEYSNALLHSLATLALEQKQNNDNDNDNEREIVE